ncbi:MAG: response regulator [Flavobacteriales bacterium]|nr:response regulator [Flavobacteriales bacterium]
MSTDIPSKSATKALDQGVYQAVMDHAPWPMVEVEGAAHLVRSVNPAFCKLLNKQDQDILGKPLADLVPHDKSILPLLDRVSSSGEAHAHAEVERIAPHPIFWSYTCWPIQAGKARRTGLMIQVTETGVFHQQATAINEALLVSSVQQHQLTDEADRLNRRLTEVIKERELAEDLLRRNHETFFNLIEHAPFGIYVVDARSRVQQVNAAARAVFAHVDPLLGRDFAEAVHVLWGDPFANEVVARFRDTLLTGIPFASPDSTNQRLDIKAKESYDWKIERVNLPNGEFGVVCYFYDISTLKQAQESLQDADRRKSEFLATLAHELRNPLAPLRNGLELLAIAPHNQATWDQAHAMMKRQLDQMVRLIDDLMDLSRITRGAVELHKDTIDLRTVLDHAVETSRPLIQRHDHTLVLDLPSEPLMVEGDDVRLSQVFVNLLTNAMKYTDMGGDIAVHAERIADEVVVTVADNGIGIATDQLTKVFDMFAQVERTSDRVQGGLGIGLNIVKHLVGMHKGRIEVASEGLGKGSCFRVVLPLVSVRAKVPATASEVTTAPVLPRRILIVDDNEDAANMMAMLLGKLGHEVLVAHNGEQAVEMGGRTEPNVVLMDLGMPVMDGYNACQLMRRTPWGERAVIVALSGWGQPEDRIKTQGAGFDEHLVKPITAATLLAMLASLEERRQRN